MHARVAWVHLYFDVPADGIFSLLPEQACMHAFNACLVEDPSVRVATANSQHLFVDHSLL